MLIDIGGLPGVVDPDVTNVPGCHVSTLQDFVWQSALLRLVFVVQNKDTEVRLFGRTKLGAGFFNVLGQLLDGIFQGRTCVINLIDDQDILAYQHVEREGGEVEPLSSSDLSARCLGGGI